MCAPAASMINLAERETFTRLLEQHGGVIRKVAFGYASTFADREDLTQEITFQLWRAFPRYSPDRPFSTWMYRIALNVAISFLRRHTRIVRQTVPFEENEIDIVAETAPTDERVALLQQVIRSLAPFDRALMLLYLDDPEDLHLGLERLQDPADPLLDWDETRRELVTQD